MTEQSEIINTDQAPAAVGPYCQARWAGELLFLSGQIGLEPGSGEMVQGGVKEQAQQVMNNLGQVLQAAGLGWSNLVKASISLIDMNDFATVNEIYASFFEGCAFLPARICVQVTALPRGALVEIEGVAKK
jgi:2-iminobutanoate/2-iminopropanoate deaminase